jgi:diguanylate cyclase (GGDEF)-like protein/PAS domain S-box-containing protein
MKCLNRSLEGIFWVNAQGETLYLNRTLGKILGYQKKDSKGLSWGEFTLNADDFKTALKDIETQESVRYSTEYRSREGSAFPVTVTMTPFRKQNVTCCYVQSDEGRESMDEGLQKEIVRLRHLCSDLERRNEELNHLVSFDFLTGSGSRVSFFREAQGALERAKRYGAPLSLLMIDIDFFKQVNDEFGHLKGDDILVQMTSLIRRSMRAADFMARWGGEEFVIILPQTGAEGAFSLGNRLCGRARTEDFCIERCLTISVGAAEYSTTDTIETLINRADHALYEAKDAGRNRAVFKKFQARQSPVTA